MWESGLEPGQDGLRPTVGFCLLLVARFCTYTPPPPNSSRVSPPCLGCFLPPLQVSVHGPQLPWGNSSSPFLSWVVRDSLGRCQLLLHV